MHLNALSVSDALFQPAAAQLFKVRDCPSIDNVHPAQLDRTLVSRITHYATRLLIVDDQRRNAEEAAPLVEIVVKKQNGHPNQNDNKPRNRGGRTSFDITFLTRLLRSK
ncbi:hypothetical protein KFU94_28775 [Chloroflexi bacterium TSY]|nr:hypothetical protein [Chloroflexi bacterium TSY]